MGKVSVVSVIRARAGMICADHNCGKAIEEGTPVVRIGKDIFHYNICAEKQGHKGLHIPFDLVSEQKKFVDPLKASKQQAAGGAKQKK